jgi:hypothetical protein
MMIVYFNDREFIACEAADDERVRADFFKTRALDKFRRLAVMGDFAYVRATAAQFPVAGGVTGGSGYGAPSLLVTTNLSDQKL